MNLENPVLGRELIENLRSAKSFWLQALFVAALGAVVVIAWPPGGRLGLEAEKSLQIYRTFALGQLVLIALVAPVLSAPAIASEHERKSFDLLLTSPLTPGDIVWGKLLSSVAFLMLLAVSSLPIFACCLFLGAIQYREIIATYLTLFSAGFLCGSIGLAASAFMGRVRGALSVSYVVILPVALIMVLANPIQEMTVSVAFAAVAVTVGAFLVFAVRGRLKRPFDTAPKSVDEEDREEQLGLVLDRKRFPDSLLSPRGSGLPLDENQNPVYQKELHHELFGRGTLLVRLLLQVSLIAALPFFIASLALKGQWIYGYYVLVFVMLIAPSLASGVFSQERERGTLDMLTTTCLGRNRILHGKLLVNLRYVAILLGFLLPLLALFWIIALSTQMMEGDALVRHWQLALCGTLGTLLSTSAFVVLLTCFFSMVCRTTLRCMVYTYATIAVLFFLPVVIYMVMTQLADFGLDEAGWLACTSPFYTLATYESTTYGPGTPFMRVPAAAPLQTAIYLCFACAASLLLYAALRLLYRRYCQFRHDRGL